MFNPISSFSKLPVFPILGTPLQTLSYCELDLSVDNSDPLFQAVDSVESFQVYIDQQLSQNKVNIGIGGYREKRNVYQRFDHFVNDEKAPRCHHLGVDIWTDSGTEIFLPVGGEIFSQSIIELDGDYGGLIIVKHTFDESFYTLYGHLSHESIGAYENGTFLKSGSLIATLGNARENGGWPPHLHFQIINEMGEYKNDYPGVCSEKNKTYFFQNCPDPAFILL